MEGAGAPGAESRAVAVRRMRRTRRLELALGIDLALVLAEALGGGFAHSTALLSDAGHNLADGTALALALVAARLVKRSPTATRSFGYHRATTMAAMANVAALLFVTALVALAGVERLLHPAPVDAATMVGVAALAVVGNTTAALVLRERRSDLNLRVAALHLAGDALAGLGVLGAGLVVLLVGPMDLLDPAVSLGIAALIALEAVHLGREGVEVLLEAAPSDIDPSELTQAITAVGGVAEVHDLHCWSLSNEVRALSAHLVLTGHPSLEGAQVVAARVRRAIAEPYAIAHSTLELECEPCREPDAPSCAFEQVVAPRA